MNSFRRGISNQNFIKALNQEYNTGGWWRKIFDDQDLFIAIRDEYINVYYKGNSLLKLSYTGGRLIAETHYKYLVRSEAKPFCIKTSGDMDFIPSGAKGTLDDYLVHNLTEIQDIKKASAAFSGIEKEGIQKIIKSNPNIVDLEIAFSKESEQDEMNPDTERNKTAKRIDFAALQKNGDHYEIVFFEAKDFSNKELRAENSAKPKVIKQICDYKKSLDQYENDIISSYKTICENYMEIIPSLCCQAVVDIANGAPLWVNSNPRLVVFGFDDDQRKGAYWGKHQEKLEDYLGQENFLAKGDPYDFKNGISHPKK